MIRRFLAIAVACFALGAAVYLAASSRARDLFTTTDQGFRG